MRNDDIRSRVFTVRGESYTAKHWAMRLGVRQTVLFDRLKNGEPPELAMRGPDSVDESAHRDELWPGANDLPWDEDFRAQYLVNCCGRLSLEQTGKVLGISRERVRQIEEFALYKLAKTLGVDTGDAVRTMLAARDAREPTLPDW
jgi:hypothetical protein